MNGQMTLADVIQDQFFDRCGNRRPLPPWVNEKRCGNCQFWELLPEYDQPPNGWGIRGICNGYSRAQYLTSQTSCCQKWKGKTL